MSKRKGEDNPEDQERKVKQKTTSNADETNDEASQSPSINQTEEVKKNGDLQAMQTGDEKKQASQNAPLDASALKSALEAIRTALKKEESLQDYSQIIPQIPKEDLAELIVEAIAAGNLEDAYFLRDNITDLAKLDAVINIAFQMAARYQDTSVAANIVKISRDENRDAMLLANKKAALGWVIGFYYDEEHNQDGEQYDKDIEAFRYIPKLILESISDKTELLETLCNVPHLLKWVAHNAVYSDDLQDLSYYSGLCESLAMTDLSGKVGTTDHKIISPLLMWAACYDRTEIVKQFMQSAEAIQKSGEDLEVEEALDMAVKFESTNSARIILGTNAIKQYHPRMQSGEAFLRSLTKYGSVRFFQANSELIVNPRRQEIAAGQCQAEFTRALAKDNLELCDHLFRLVPEEQRKAFLNGLTLKWIPSSIDDIDLPFLQAYVIRQAIRDLSETLRAFKELKKEGLVDLPGVIENLVLDYVSPYFDSSDSLVSSVVTKCIERLAAPTENKEAMMLESAEPMMLEGENKAGSDIPNYVVSFHKKRSELAAAREKYEENEDMVYELISEVVSEVRAASEKFASAFNNANASSQGSEAGDENTTPMEDDDQTNSSMKPTSAQSLNKNSQSNSQNNSHGNSIGS